MNIHCPFSYPILYIFYVYYILLCILHTIYYCVYYILLYIYYCVYYILLCILYTIYFLFVLGFNIVLHALVYMSVYNIYEETRLDLILLAFVNFLRNNRTQNCEQKENFWLCKLHACIVKVFLFYFAKNIQFITKFYKYHCFT